MPRAKWPYHDQQPARSRREVGRARVVDSPRCPVCAQPVPASDCLRCSACAVPHHRDCFVYARGCAIYGCQGRSPNGRSWLERPLLAAAKAGMDAAATAGCDVARVLGEVLVVPAWCAVRDVGAFVLALWVVAYRFAGVRPRR